MAQRVRRKKDRSSVKGVAVRKNNSQTVNVTKYGNVTSVEVKSGGKNSGNKKANELTIDEIWEMFENGVRLIISDGTVAGTEKE